MRAVRTHWLGYVRGRLEDMGKRAKVCGSTFRRCLACGEDYEVPKKWAYRYYCLPCATQAEDARSAAMYQVNRAIRIGVLMRADQFRCADCAKWAQVWDHRDYAKPLTVEPLCYSCNRRRPAAYRVTLQ